MSTLPERDSDLDLEHHDPAPPTEATEPVSFKDPDPMETWPLEPWPSQPLPADPDQAPQYDALSDHPAPETLMFQTWYRPQVIAPERVPNLFHLAILGVLAFLGSAGALLLTWSALHFHLFGVSSVDKAMTDIHYTLGNQAATYLLSLLACLLLFPLVWHKGFFAGLQWNGATALHLRKRLFGAAFLCFILAIVDGIVFQETKDAPIDKIFKSPGAAWLLFVFGVTFAPFFEEIVFRGFLLPALCTAYDWIAEKTVAQPILPLDPNGHPQWSVGAMIVASILTSVPFALMHAEQTAFALGPFLLLVCVSLVLCWARLSTRSLAASVLVHASYNLILFSLMIIGTGGFQHMDKM